MDPRGFPTSLPECYGERKLRQKTIKEHGPYIKQLEQKIDPNRSSSGLTETGKPKKEDLDAP